MKLWFQKHITVGKVPALDDGYERHAKKMARPDTEVVFHGMPKVAYEGSFPNEMVNYSFPETMFTSYFLARALEAERAGYDAFIIGTAPDAGLRDARTLIDIPVIGYSEISMHMACMLGTHFAYVGFVDMQHRHEENARIYGLGERIRPWGRVAVTARQVQDALEGRADVFLKAFFETARKSIADGANVIIPNEGLTNEVLYHQGVCDVDGVPIIDSSGLVIKQAELMVDMQKMSGMHTSRKGYYFAKPPTEMVDHMMGLYGAK